jgi:hypothetical protein
MAQQHALIFEMAAREATKAWRSTPMLARTYHAKVQAVVEVACGAAPQALAALLMDIAGPSFTSLAAAGKVDPERAARLCESVVVAALADSAPRAERAAQCEDQSAPRRANARLQALQECLRDWLACEGPANWEGELCRIDRLIERDDPQLASRLGLIAPMPAVLAVCTVALEAMDAGYPLRGAARAGAQTEPEVPQSAEEPI